MSNTHPHLIRTFGRQEAVPVGVDSLGEVLKWDISESDRGFLGHVSSPEEYHEAFRGQAIKKRIEDFLARPTGLLPAAAMSGWLKKHEADHGYFDETPGKVIAQDSVLGVMDSEIVLGVRTEPRLYARSIAEFFKSFSHRPYPKSSGQQWREKIKKEVSGLLESGETEEEVAPEAVKYACQIVDRLPAECAFLPSPDVSGFADKKAVYFEWLLETDGRLLLTVEPDGTVAYVCTFGNARSRNLGAWEDDIVDLMRPCFVKLAQLHKKDFHAWDASRTAHLSPDLLSKAER